MYYLTAEASFDAAHFLDGYPGKCANLHGHRWRVIAKIAGERLQTEGACAGMLLDFSEIKSELRTLAETLDHRTIIEKGSLALATMDAFESEGFELVELPFRPTAEQLARYFFEELKKRDLPICAVTVFETPDNSATYEESE